MEGWPFWTVYVALFAIVFARTQATYWIGRGVGAGVRHTRRGKLLGSRLDRAENLINRFGPPMVTVAYVTVGIQTAIHLAAGAMRMHFVRYLLAMIPGCAVWAAIYSLGGMAVIAVWWRAFLESPGEAVAFAVAALAGVGALLYWRRHRDVRTVERSPEEREPAAS